MIYIITIVVFVLLIIFWLFIRPLLKYRNRLSYKTREEIYPDIIELDKTIITICSAAIILTIHLIGKPVIEKNYLIISWVTNYMHGIWNFDIIGKLYSQSSWESIFKWRI